MPPDMQIPSARTTTYSHRKQRVSPSVSHLSRRVSSRLARQSPNQPEPHASHPLVARPSPAGRLHRRRARVSRARTHDTHDTTPSRARRACTPTRVFDHHPAASTHHVLALQQLLGDDRGQSTEEVTLGVDDDNLRCASMGLVRQSSRSVVSSFASSSASIDPSFRVVGKTPNARDGSRDRSRPSRATSRDARSVVRGERVIFIHLARVLARSSTHLIHDARLRERRTGRRAREVVPVDTVVRVWVETDAGERYCTCYN